MTTPGAPRGVRPWPLATAVFCAAVLMEFSGAYGVLETKAPVSPFIAVLGIGLVIAVVRMVWQRPAVPLAAVAAVTAYLLGVTISALASHLDPLVTSEGVSTVLKELAFVAVLTVLGVGTGRWQAIAGCIVVPTGVISALSGLNEWVLHNTQNFFGFETVTTALGVGTTAARHAGPLPDANFWGRYLVIAVPFCLALGYAARRRRRGFAQLLWAGHLVALLGGIYLTGSRGTFIATAVGVVVFVLAVGFPWQRVLTWSIVVGAVSLAVPGVGSRLLTVFDLADEGQRVAVDGSILERLATARVATEMFLDTPLVGVGPTGYFSAFPEYAAQTQLSLSRVVAPHNLYLGLAAEIGVIGVAGFLAVAVTALWAALRMVARTRLSATRGLRGLSPYTAAILGALVSWLAASAFLHLAYVRVFWIVCVMAVVTDRRVAEQWRLAGAVRRSVVRTRWTVRTGVSRVRWAAVGLAAGAALGCGLVLAQPVPHSASVVGHLTPWRENSVYSLSLRSRVAILPTFAVVIGSVNPDVDSQGDPVAGSVTITTSAATAAEASRRLQAVTTGGDQLVKDLGLTRLYRVRWSPVQADPPSGRMSMLAAAGLGVGCLGAFVASGLVALRARRRTGG